MPIARVHWQGPGWYVLIPFRVLVGFLPMVKVVVLKSDENRFNPFQGFGGVSALHVRFFATHAGNYVLIPFRVLVGFLQQPDWAR